VRVRGRSLENRFVTVVLEPNGALSLNDRRHNERYGDLLRLEDAGDAGRRVHVLPAGARPHQAESRSRSRCGVWRAWSVGRRPGGSMGNVRGIDVRR